MSLAIIWMSKFGFFFLELYRAEKSADPGAQIDDDPIPGSFISKQPFFPSVQRKRNSLFWSIGCLSKMLHISENVKQVIKQNEWL